MRKKIWYTLLNLEVLKSIKTAQFDMTNPVVQANSLIWYMQSKNPLILLWPYTVILNKFQTFNKL